MPVPSNLLPFNNSRRELLRRRVLLSLIPSEAKNKSKLVEHLRFLSLFVFDGLGNHRIARRAFKRAFVVIRLVWLNSREPHRYVAFSMLTHVAETWGRIADDLSAKQNRRGLLG
jgi:hypothetical protein